METAKQILLILWNLVIFVLVSALFLPAFFIVTLLQPLWSDKLKEVFGL